MNETIHKFIEASKIDIRDEFGHWIGFQVDQEKFAEMIINQIMFEIMYESTQNHDSQWKLIVAVREKIKQKYGV